jgi:toxin CcdB
MAQYTVYKNLNVNTNKVYPYLMNVQSDFLENLDSRLVIPLAAKNYFKNIEIQKLTPVINIGGRDFLLLTPQMASIHKKHLKEPAADCSSIHNIILSSIDFLISGF